MITDWRRRTALELGRTHNHIYLRPHRLLRPYIAHYTIWTADAIPQPGGQLMLVPDASGCMVLHLNGDRLTGKLWGATTRVVTVDGGAVGAPVRIFAEFAPGGLYQLTGMGQAALADGIFALDDVLPELYASLTQLVETARCTEQLVAGLDRLLLPLLLSRDTPCTPLSVTNALQQTSGLMSVEALSLREGYSARHLGRLLHDYLGMGPKQFARLLRVNAAVRLLGSGQPLTYLAQESGFYDQAHFIRDFSRICGVTPGDYRDRMSDFYNEPLKL